MAEIEVIIHTLREAHKTELKIVILKEKEGERFLPIWIGPYEADAIARKLANIAVAPPLTHDLLCSIVDTVGLKIKSVVINKVEAIFIDKPKKFVTSTIKEDIFYAKLVVISNDKTYEIDCRPSDALAIALRVDAPIFVDGEILEKFGFTIDK